MDLVTEEINKALALLNIQSEKFSLLSDKKTKRGQVRFVKYKSIVCF